MKTSLLPNLRIRGAQQVSAAAAMLPVLVLFVGAWSVCVSLDISEHFAVEEKSFCPGASAFSLSAASDIDCAVECVQRPACCGFVPQERRCSLLEGAPPNLRPTGWAAGPCRVRRRRRCLDAPPLFTTLLPAAPRRVFYFSNSTQRLDAATGV